MTLIKLIEQARKEGTWLTCIYNPGLNFTPNELLQKHPDWDAGLLKLIDPQILIDKKEIEIKDLKLELAQLKRRIEESKNSQNKT